MDINLSLISDEYISFEISNKNKEIINNINNKEEENTIKNDKKEIIIKEEIKNSNIILKNYIKDEYYDIKINKNEKYNKEID